MIKKTIMSLLFTVTLCFLFSEQLVKASDRLNEVYQEIKSTSEMVHVYIVMSEQYNTEHLSGESHNTLRSKQTDHVVHALSRFSRRTQSDLRIELQELERENKIANIHYLWIKNVIGMEASASALKMIDNHPDIESIEYDPLEKLLDSTLINEETKKIINSPLSNLNKDNTNPKLSQDDIVVTDNVKKVNSPQVWNMGYKGQGAVVAVLDTGVNYNHHDLRNRMWTHPDFPNHGYNFVSNNLDPDDDHGHGTHCAGTIAGDGTSGYLTGVAPESKIMALKMMNSQGSGNTQFTLAAYQFAVFHKADIISASFGSNSADSTSRRIQREALENVLSAGIVVSAAAGNSGSEQDDYPIPHNISTPGSSPPPWLHPDQTLTGGKTSVITVGATNNNDQIASFSSRGPTTWQDVSPYNDYNYDPGIGLIKPDVVAPGVDVTSLRHNNDTGYTSMSGTSMAAPAVSGAVALMLSKDPGLKPADICRILEVTAHPLSQSKSNIYGSGRIDVAKAIENVKYIEIKDFSFEGIDNRNPEYGERVNLSITLQNNADFDAESVVGTLSSDDDYVSITKNKAVFGDIQAGFNTTIKEAFTIEIVDNIPHDYLLSFSVHIAPANDSYSWNDHFSFNVNAPHLQLQVPLIAASGEGDNFFIEPGDSLKVYIPIANTGGSKTGPVHIYIDTTSDQIDIHETSPFFYSYIEKNDIVYPSIELYVHTDTSMESLILLDCTIISENYTFEDRFSLIIGNSLQTTIGEGVATNEATYPAPINTYFHSLRSQMIYTSQELQNAGLSGKLPITKLGFYVDSSPDQPLPDFKVRMKHTESDNVLTHNDGPFIEVYSTSYYRPNSNGWDLLDLDTTFVWNGVDNILVDTAFAPVDSVSASGQIRVYDVVDGYRYTRDDDYDQSYAKTIKLSNNKPQIAFTCDISVTKDPLAPINLQAELIIDKVRLDWDVNRLRQKSNSHINLYNKQEYHRNDKILKGFNVYRNGNKINNGLVIDKYYIDDDVKASASYYYSVTAVYEKHESQPSEIVSFEGIAIPLFDPPSGIKSNPFLLTINSLTSDTQIYYTLNGDKPTQSSNKYKGPVEITDNAYVKAIAYKEGFIHSLVNSAEYVFLKQPTNLTVDESLNHAYLSWNYPDWRSMPNRVSLSNRNRSLNNDRVSNNRNTRSFIGYNLYRSYNSNDFKQLNQFLVTENQYFDGDLKAGRYKYSITAVYERGESERTEAVIAYVGMAATPFFSVEPGFYDHPIELYIESQTDDATIKYTLDGSIPDMNSPIFAKDKPIIIDKDTVVKTIATKEGLKNSFLVEGEYLIETSDVEDINDTPLLTRLHNAYPNPFNPQTTIKFSLKAEDYVNLNIYDIRGRLVETLVDERLSAGTYEYIWHYERHQQKTLSSGIYLYRLQTSDYLEVKKILLLK